MLLPLVAAAPLRADPPPIPYTLTVQDGVFQFTLQQSSAMYFALERTPDLVQPFAKRKLALGTPGPVLQDTPATGAAQAFFRLKGIPNYAPDDSDGDGIDDIWELEHGLNPLDPADANLPSTTVGGMTNLQVYRAQFGFSSAKPQFYSREVSAFNFGALISTPSREVSVFNFGAQFTSVEAISREVSVFNGQMPPVADFPQVYSREVSAYNFGAAPTAAVSREVSVFNGERPPVADYPAVYSREVSVFNFGAQLTAVEAISREVSVLNNIP